MKQISSGYHSTFILVHMYLRLRYLLLFLSFSCSLMYSDSELSTFLLSSSIWLESSRFWVFSWSSSPGSVWTCNFNFSSSLSAFSSSICYTIFFFLFTRSLFFVLIFSFVLFNSSMWFSCILLVFSKSAILVLFFLIIFSFLFVSLLFFSFLFCFRRSRVCPRVGRFCFLMCLFMFLNRWVPSPN